MLIVITGVSGTGKTTVGSDIADTLGLPFYDADNFHPAENIEKMSLGFPLNDEDRLPWLQTLADLLTKSEQTDGAVLACSALKESYRELLKVQENIFWIHLKGDRELIWRRMLARKNHYMKASMLDSQFATWEEPNYGLKLNICKTPEEMLAEALKYLGVPMRSDK
ncbi:gluconokinase [Algoriphagus aquimarinus]|uniref:Gluconokinase n=1 Tax=Algoriphagus aquimarinus TaxID=237018 RepID=A0A1I0XGV1_9BACT|nr:gluconokinase [Algoriphagus aquimarinus]SFB00232.1 gluconate kinase, SKI family [Algoriphagus aquimarinus]